MTAFAGVVVAALAVPVLADSWCCL